MLVSDHASALLEGLDAVLARLPGGAGGLLHRRLLVVGGGEADGLALLLACAGAQVTALAPGGPQQRRERLEPLAGELLAALPGTRPTLDPGPLLALVGRPLPDGRPALPPILGDWLGAPRPADLAPFDVVVTHDLLGRVADLRATVAWLADQLPPRGPCLHWVDTRDVLGPDRPLETLTQDLPSFQAYHGATAGACGNRWRPDALVAALAEAGFEPGRFEVVERADPDYVAGLLPRLHGDFAGMQPGSLEALTGWLAGRRRAGLNTEYPTADDHPQTLAHSRCRYAHAAPLVAGRRVLDVGSGAGLGTAELVAAGAASVVGIEKRPEALALAGAAAADGSAVTPRWLRADLERGLPLADASVDVVVALEVLEHVRAQSALVAELRRVLAPGGVAVVSVPHAPFERLWTDLAGEPNPYHLHVPDLDEFVGLFAGFGRVELSAQVDTVASLVLPLSSGRAGDGASAGGDGPAAGDTAAADAVQQAGLVVPAAVPLSDRGTVTVIATAFLDADAPAAPRPVVGHAYGDHQARMADSIQATERLKGEYDELRAEAFAARNQLAWRELEDGED